MPTNQQSTLQSEGYNLLQSILAPEQSHEANE